tara:strand:- start:339 stop:839 length:501 start_codon:yes stop_codon:yes gene_type:complete
MNKILITAIGTDRPGLVNKITSAINYNNGNIDNSKMIKINNQFAIIIDFSLSGEIESILSELKKIKDLEFSYKKIKTDNLNNRIAKTYLMKGADDQGIINTISEYFKNKKVNIIEIDTFIELAPITGAPLFNMKISIDSNNESDLNQMTKEISEISKNLNLDITLI